MRYRYLIVRALPDLEKVAEDNRHFVGPVKLVSRSHAANMDPWAADRGYTDVALFEDSDDRQAVYGFHEPSMLWNLWAN